MVVPQFGEIVCAIKLCDKLIRTCFDPINNASLKYADFKQDVHHLQNRLHHLKYELEKALTHSDLDSCRYRQLKGEIDLVAGDFNKTLEACEKLLSKHIRHDGSPRSSALDNLFWNCSTQAQVDLLQSRLKSHAYKIGLIIEPVQLGLVNRIDYTTLESHRILEQLRVRFGIIDAAPLPDIPRSIERKLEEGFQKVRPGNAEASNEISLQDGVDVLCEHFLQCTLQCTSPGTDSTSVENLSLLKAHWLSKMLEERIRLRHTPADSLFVRIIHQVGQGVRKQYQTRRISEWHEEIFLELDDSAFDIWPPKPVVHFPDPAKPDTHEKQILEIELVSHYSGVKQTLLIFHIAEKMLRTVLSHQEGTSNITNISTSINLHQDVFVPRYTVTNTDADGLKRWNVEVIDGKGGSQTVYQLHSHKHAHEVQMAFTGKQVRSHHESTSCTLTWKSEILRDRKIRDIQFSGKGEIQMWRASSNTAVDSGDSSRRLSTQTSRSEPSGTGSSSTTSLVSRALSQLHADVHSVYENQQGTELVVAQRPSPPTMVGFLKKGNEYLMWCLDLSPDIYIKKQSSRKSKSRRIELVSSHLPLRTLWVTESRLPHWNLLALVDPSYTLPSSSSSPSSAGNHPPAVCIVHGTSIVFDFGTEEELEIFLTCFTIVRGEHQEQIDAFDRARQLAATQADQPRQVVKSDITPTSTIPLPPAPTIPVPPAPTISLPPALTIPELPNFTDLTSELGL